MLTKRDFNLHGSYFSQTYNYGEKRNSLKPLSTCNNNYLMNDYLTFRSFICVMFLNNSNNEILGK